jgi:ABC-type phosphate transport system permease subunit
MIDPADEQEPRTRGANDALLESFDELAGIKDLRRLPAIIVGGLLGFAIFVAAAALLALAYVALVELLNPTGALGAALGFAWLGGSLAITAVVLTRVLRRINRLLRRRKMPTLY